MCKCRKPIQFLVKASNAPTNGQVGYSNSELAWDKSYLVFDASKGRFLIEGVDFVYEVTGGFTLLNNIAFATNEEFTLIPF